MNRNCLQCRRAFLAKFATDVFCSVPCDDTWFDLHTGETWDALQPFMVWSWKGNDRPVVSLVKAYADAYVRVAAESPVPEWELYDRRGGVIRDAWIMGVRNDLDRLGDWFWSTPLADR